MPGVSQLDAGSGSGNGSSGSGSGGQQKGQKPRYQDGQKSYRYIDVTQDETRASGTNVRAYLQDGNAYYDVNADKNFYCGAAKGKAQFATIVTVRGPTANVQGKIG